MMQVSPLAVAAEEGERVWFDGGLVTFKATGAQNGGAFTMVEAMMPQGKASPLHVHREADETFYVLEGGILTYVHGAERYAAQGAVTMVPRGIPHAFRVVAGPARLLVVFTPACTIMEAFFRAAGMPAPAATLAPEDTPVERLMAAAKRTGLEVLGPPPFVPAM